LITEDNSDGIRLYYKCYKAVLAATLKYEELRKAGDWDAPFIPTINDFALIVTSRSMWYSHYKHFEKVSRYPQMIKWLNETEDAIGDIELWGFECDVYQWAHLEGFLKRDGKPLEDSEDESEEAKAQVKKKKTHKKVNTKGKAKAKVASSSGEKSDSELESAEKPRKKHTKGKAKAASPSGEESEFESASVQKSRKKNVASGSRRR
jgi:hypothetical protein